MSIPDKFQALVAQSSYAALARIGVVRLFKKGAVLISERDTDSTIFVLLNGAVKVYSEDDQGRQLLHGEYEAECLLGEMSINGTTRSATVQVTRDAVCALVQVDQLKSQLQSDPDLAMQVIALLISRSRRATQISKQLALDSVYRRVAQLVQAKEPPSANGVNLPLPFGHPILLSQQQIASRVGASRDMVSKIFKTLVEGGYITKSGRVFHLQKQLPRDW